MEKNYKNDIEYILRRMPFWIDVKDFGEYNLWRKLYRCNCVLRRLISERVLSEIEVDEIWWDFDYYFRKITEEKYEIEISLYYGTMIGEIMEIVLELEEYSVAANIQKLIEKYFRNRIFVL
jgi:hypothetical protein